MTGGGNPMFNLNEAIPAELTEEDMMPKATESEPVDFNKIEEQRFAQPPRAIAAITNEDLAFEAELQRLHLSQDIPAQDQGVPLKVTREPSEVMFLGYEVDNYKPAASINELEAQVFSAKTRGCNAIEASEDVIRYYTRHDYPTKVGYFMFKDIRVFIPGRASTYADQDSKNMFTSMGY